MNRAYWLTSLISEHRWTLGAEIGVAQGFTSLKLLKLNPDLYLTGIDVKPHVKFHHPRFEYISSDSSDFGMKTPCFFDFVFIDGDHSYEGVVRDIRAYEKKCTFLCGHDYCEKWPGVMQAVDELIPNRELGPDFCWYRP